MNQVAERPKDDCERFTLENDRHLVYTTRDTHVSNTFTNPNAFTDPTVKCSAKSITSIRYGTRNLKNMRAHRERRRLPSPAASSIEHGPRSRESCPPGTVNASLSTGWDVIRDSKAVLADRINVLWERLYDDEDRVREFVASELANNNDIELRDAIAIFAEHVQFASESSRSAVVDRLLTIAKEHAFGPAAGNVEIFNSAIRTVASMIEADRLEEFLPFLEPPVKFDTHHITFHALIRILEIDGPTESHRRLSDRVHVLTTLYLNRELILPGSQSARAQAAVTALAALGDNRIVETVRRVAALEIPRFSRRIKKRLKILRGQWAETVARDTPGYLNLQRAEEEL